MTAILVLVAFALVGPIVVGTIRPPSRGRSSASDPGPVGESGLRWLTATALALGLISTWTTASLLVPPIAVALVAVVPLVLVLCVRRRSDGALPGPPAVARLPRTPKALVVLALATFAVAAAVVVARLVRSPDGDWDAFAIWNLRARLLVREPGDLATFAIGAHADYPLLLPGLVATGWAAFHDGASSVSGAISMLFFAMATAGICVVVKPRRGTTVAIFAALAYVAMPHVLRLAPGRYADVPLSAFLVLGVGWLASAYERPTAARSAVALAGLCASLGAWTKNEGAVHVVAIGLVLLLRPPSGVSRGRVISSYLAGAAPFLAVLVAFKAGIAPESEYTAAAVPARLLERLGDGSRHVTIARHALAELASFGHWRYLLPAAILIAAFHPRRDSADVPVSRTVGLVALAYGVIYLVTPHPLDWQLRWSIDRLLVQLVPALLVAAALRLAPPVSPSPTPSPSDA